MTNTERKGKVFPLSISQTCYDRLKESAEYFGVSMSEIARQGINDIYSRIVKEKFGMRGSELANRKIKKENLEKFIAERKQQLAEMSPLELTSYLRSVGYTEEDEKMPGGAIRRYLIIDKPAGRMYCCSQIESDGTQSYASDVLTFEELFRDLKKKNKL